MKKTKFAIGCLIQWYEVNVVGEYLETLKKAIQQYDGEVLVDFTVVGNQDLEKCVSEEKFTESISKIYKSIEEKSFDKMSCEYVESIYTVADYRRIFNSKYCEITDILIWGESDMLVPLQMFTALDTLHQNSQYPKYIATFGICKMWDTTWKALEHPKFTDKPHSDLDSDWWGVNYNMSSEEMNSFNNEVEELDLRVFDTPKFNGCGLVIASEVVKAGVNIPKSVFFIHEDTAFMLMMQRVLGNIPQYHFRNILLVHNRKHKRKRSYVTGESGKTLGQQRNSNKWYSVANKMCEQNCYNLFNLNYKSYTWKDVWKAL